jgi:hypothetical protein
MHHLIEGETEYNAFFYTRAHRKKQPPHCGPYTYQGEQFLWAPGLALQVSGYKKR